MGACVWLQDGKCSAWFPVDHQGSVLASLLFNIFLATAIYVVFTGFEADKDMMDAVVSPRKKTGRVGGG